MRLPNLFNLNEPEAPLDIHDEETPKCGGTLIGKKHVLTTAKCVCGPRNLQPSAETCTLWRNMTAMVGDHDIRNEDDQQIVKIEGMILYKNYTGIERYVSIQTQNCIIQRLVSSTHF